MKTTQTIRLTHMAEVDDLRLICWNADWLKSVVKVWRLKPGEGVLYINRAHNRLRAVVLLDVPVLVCFPVNKLCQSVVFTATIEALVSGKSVRLEATVKHTLATGDWNHIDRKGRISIAA